MEGVQYSDAKVTVYRSVVGYLDTNVYIVQCNDTKLSVLIDAAGEPEHLLVLAERHNVERVLTTHWHPDHTGATREFHSAGKPIGASAIDAPRIPIWDDIIDDGEVIEIGNLRIEALFTPGHSAGSLCFSVHETPLLFTGDTLFPGGPGATKYPDSSFTLIIESVSKLLDRFDDQTIVLPGHGRNTTIGAERPHLGEWKARGW